MKLYLDDIRFPPKGFKLIRTVNQLKSFVKKYGEKIEVLDLDYDMGMNSVDGGNGIDFLKWLEEEVFTGKLHLNRNLKIECHSSNMEKRRKMEEIAAGIMAFLRSQR
ncbi:MULTISPECIES: cyclic-phosphate processing receiver domain-containing protein [unclassified Desulfurobacterium]|uniref:cyclic-phosphate processing receiver domain-containing protein n=1 Tax=unclassified Desulfurobacterium TaxID=2639089 RepID=UPI000482421B|nr:MULTISPECIES: cyclic-phosphate processing receiver domain-containing protein [unclassified Desulfurobacterium]